jgi:apolipoprotein N-acyltransferase
MQQMRAPRAARISVGVLQPNRPPVYRWTPIAADRALIAHLRLSQQHLGDTEVDVIVWPENAIPSYPERDPHLEARLARFAETMDAALILGAPGTGDDATDPTAFNAAHLIVPERGLTATYHKRRLVPFAEYRPVVGPPARGGPAQAFTVGDEPEVFAINGVRLGPTICLDFVFADIVRASVRAGAQVLVNLSNDSWLAAGGPGAAAQQHAQAVFRAVENRRDVVRATTTGISAALSAAGVPLATLDEGRAGAFVADVTPRDQESFYTRWGDLFAVCCAVLGIVTVIGRRRESKPTITW